MINYITKLTKLLAKILYSIYAAITNAFYIVQEARIASAEFDVARMLHREYPHENFSYILQMVKESRTDELIK